MAKPTKRSVKGRRNGRPYEGPPRAKDAEPAETDESRQERYERLGGLLKSLSPDVRRAWTPPATFDPAGFKALTDEELSALEEGTAVVRWCPSCRRVQCGLWGQDVPRGPRRCAQDWPLVMSVAVDSTVVQA